MNDALILTPEQATALLAANGDSPRQIEPRRLEDGTFLLNADVLDDPLFSDPQKPWLAPLQSIPEPKQDAKSLAEIDIIDSAAREARLQLEVAEALEG